MDGIRKEVPPEHEAKPLFFPLYVNLSQKRFTIVGGGRIATRRVLSLLDFAGRITVVSPELSPELESLAREGKIEPRRRTFLPGDLTDADFVLSATGVQEVDDLVYAQCRQQRIPVNVSSNKDKCDFYFPGIARRGNLVVGVSAGGTDHRLAKRITEEVRALLERLKL